MKKEINKKLLVLSLVLISLVLISLIAVYAQGTATTGQNSMDNAARWISQQISSISIGNFQWNDPDTVTPILLGILLWMVLYSVLVKSGLFKRSSGEFGFMAAAVAIVITFLAFNFTPTGFWKVIIEQYRALGAAILTLIPFLIMFYFTTAVSENSLMSTLFWMVYVFYYFGALLYEIANSQESWMSGVTLPYWIAIAAGVLVIIFLRPIRNWFWRGELKAEKELGIRTVTKARVGAEILGSAEEQFGHSARV